MHSLSIADTEKKEFDKNHNHGTLMHIYIYIVDEKIALRVRYKRAKNTHPGLFKFWLFLIRDVNSNFAMLLHTMRGNGFGIPR